MKTPPFADPDVPVYLHPLGAVVIAVAQILCIKNKWHNSDVILSEIAFLPARHFDLEQHPELQKKPHVTAPMFLWDRVEGYLRWRQYSYDPLSKAPAWLEEKP